MSQFFFNSLKQVEDENEKRAAEIHEMSKPFARYKDDEDLDRLLRAEIRDEDPMAAYIRAKRVKNNPLGEYAYPVIMI